MARKQNWPYLKVKYVPPLVVICILPGPTGDRALPKPLCLLSHSMKVFPLLQKGRQEPFWRGCHSRQNIKNQFR